MHDQLQETKDRLIRVPRQARDKIEGIFGRMQVVIEEVVRMNLDRTNPKEKALRVENKVEPTKETGSASSIMD